VTDKTTSTTTAKRVVVDLLELSADVVAASSAPSTAAFNCEVWVGVSVVLEVVVARVVVVVVVVAVVVAVVGVVEVVSDVAVAVDVAVNVETVLLLCATNNVVNMAALVLTSAKMVLAAIVASITVAALDVVVSVVEVAGAPVVGSSSPSPPPPSAPFLLAEADGPAHSDGLVRLEGSTIIYTAPSVCPGFADRLTSTLYHHTIADGVALWWGDQEESAHVQAKCYVWFESIHSSPPPLM
jgi:hypothetical protein